MKFVSMQKEGDKFGDFFGETQEQEASKRVLKEKFYDDFRRLCG